MRFFFNLLVVSSKNPLLKSLEFGILTNTRKYIYQSDLETQELEEDLGSIKTYH